MEYTEQKEMWEDVFGRVTRNPEDLFCEETFWNQLIVDKYEKGEITSSWARKSLFELLKKNGFDIELPKGWTWDKEIN